MVTDVTIRTFLTFVQVLIKYKPLSHQGKIDTTHFLIVENLKVIMLLKLVLWTSLIVCMSHSEIMAT